MPWIRIAQKQRRRGGNTLQLRLQIDISGLPPALSILCVPGETHQPCTPRTGEWQRSAPDLGYEGRGIRGGLLSGRQSLSRSARTPDIPISLFIGGGLETLLPPDE